MTSLPTTQAPNQVWVCIWEVYGDLPPSLTIRRPAVLLPNRSHYLARAPKRSLKGERGRRANIWWPADQTWRVATEVDLDPTYVGFSGQAIDAIQASPLFEALETSPDDRIDGAGDRINPSPKSPVVGLTFGSHRSNRLFAPWRRRRSSEVLRTPRRPRKQR